MLKKRFKTAILSAALMLTVTSATSAMPASQDPTEPNNNYYGISYEYSQNVLTSFIQSSNDLDYWNFVSPKTGLQEFGLLPTNGKEYYFGLYEYGSGTPLFWTSANGLNGTTSAFANLVAAKKYSVLVMSKNGSYDVDNPYYIGTPVLFPY